MQQAHLVHLENRVCTCSRSDVDRSAGADPTDQMFGNDEASIRSAVDLALEAPGLEAYRNSEARFVGDNPAIGPAKPARAETDLSRRIIYRQQAIVKKIPADDSHDRRLARLAVKIIITRLKLDVTLLKRT